MAPSPGHSVPGRLYEESHPMATTPDEILALAQAEKAVERLKLELAALKTTITEADAALARKAIGDKRHAEVTQNAAQHAAALSTRLKEEQQRVELLTTGQNEYTRALARQQAAQAKQAAAAEKAAQRQAEAGKGFQSFGYGVLFASQAIEDLQYGFHAIVN